MSIQEFVCTLCGKTEDFFDDEMKQEEGTDLFVSQVECDCGNNLWAKNDQKAHIWAGRSYYSHARIFPDSMETRDLIVEKAGKAAFEEFERNNEDLKMNIGRPLEGEEDGEIWAS